MAGGRPTKYTKSLIKKVDEYLALRKDETKQVVKYEGDKSTGYETKIVVKLPTIIGFARFIGVSEQTLYNWAEEHKEFLESLEKIKAEQQERLVDSGLSGDYNPTIAKLILSANHGMAEKTETKVSKAPKVPRSKEEEADIKEAEEAAAKAYEQVMKKKMMAKTPRKKKAPAKKKSTKKKK